MARMRTDSRQDLSLLLGRYHAVGIWDREAGGVDEKTDGEERWWAEEFALYIVGKESLWKVLRMRFDLACFVLVFKFWFSVTHVP